jgi:hypothetical protein
MDQLDLIAYALREYLRAHLGENTARWMDGDLYCGDTHHGIMLGFSIARREELMISPYFIEQVLALDVWSEEDLEMLNEDIAQLPLWWELAS